MKQKKKNVFFVFLPEYYKINLHLVCSHLTQDNRKLSRGTFVKTANPLDLKTCIESNVSNSVGTGSDLEIIVSDYIYFLCMYPEQKM